MKKYQLIKNPKLFQGEKDLKKQTLYFEGWYFKNTNDQGSIAFIPGINMNQKERKAFIQIITNDISYNVDYDIVEFGYCHDPFYIQIGKNYFSDEKIVIDIYDERQNLVIMGDLNFTKGVNITSNIMGPFGYLPFMECNHAILQMKAKANGLIEMNGKKYLFKDGISYIEKDWGTSFPKSYVWMQANSFQNDKASFMLSIADIPFGLVCFTGLICSLLVEGKEYRFATYNNAKIIDYTMEDDCLEIQLKKGCMILLIEAYLTSGHELLAPKNGEMNTTILESISSIIKVTLKENGKIIFEDTSLHCGLEIVI